MSDPISDHQARQEAAQQHRDIGKLGALIGEAVVRMDRVEGRFKSVDERLVQVLTVVSKAEVKNVLLSAVIGAFCGSLGGIATAALMLHYAVTQGWI